MTDVYEPERIDSMRSLLHPGDILLDIGAEKGTQSIFYAEMVGVENLCMLEPEPTVWPNIRVNFETAGLSAPMHCCVGLASNTTVGVIEFTGDCWPSAADGTPTDNRIFRYIHSHDSTGQIRIDDWTMREFIVPRAITIDVEGAELVVLQGAERVLSTYHPLVWCSIHPDLMMKDYNQSPDALQAYMTRLGYTGELLAIDHEQHWLFK